MTDHNEVRDHLSKAIAELEQCAASSSGNDTVLAWDNYLGVKFFDGKGTAVQITDATSLNGLSAKNIPEVTNGRGEKATLTKRSDVAIKQAKHLQMILTERFPEQII